MAANDVGQRGKTAERLAKAQLLRLSKLSAIHHYRFPDARSGSMVAAPSDYLLLVEGLSIFLEVKETESKTRLPFQNFGKDQVARMRRFELAGAHPLVIIYHSSLKAWRSPEFEIFTTRDEGTGSWDLSSFGLITSPDFLWEILCLRKLQPQSVNLSVIGL